MQDTLSESTSFPGTEMFSVTAISDSSISYLSNKRLNFPPVVFESGRDRIKDETARALLISKEIIDLCAEKIRP